MQRFTINTHRSLSTITSEQREALTLLSDTFPPYTDKRVFSYKQAVNALVSQQYDAQTAGGRVSELLRLGYLVVVSE